MSDPAWMRLAFDPMFGREFASPQVVGNLMGLFDPQPDWRNMMVLAQAPAEAPVDIHESTQSRRQYLTPGLAPVLVGKARRKRGGAERQAGR